MKVNNIDAASENAEIKYAKSNQLYYGLRPAQTTMAMNPLATQLTLDDFGRETASTITGSNQSVLTIQQTFVLNDQILTRTTKRGNDILRAETYEHGERNRSKH